MQRRPARSERKNRVFFPRSDRPYGLKRAAFQTEDAPVIPAAVAQAPKGAFLERLAFEKGETRGGGTAPPGPK